MNAGMILISFDRTRRLVFGGQTRTVNQSYRSAIEGFLHT